MLDEAVLPPHPPGNGEEERACWLALSEVEGLGPRAVLELVRRHGSARAAWLRGGPGLPPRARHGLLEARRRTCPRRLLEEARRRGERILIPLDGDYPARLGHLYDPPAVLRVRGSAFPLPEGPAVAVVGTRRATPYGLSVARRLGRDLASAGVVVVSGLARGVDGAAHRGSLEGGGPTLAVLGCGIEVEYPRSHRRLRRDLEACGAVVTEYPARAEPRPWHFPARNRILAALVSAVVVVEAARHSGALVTARLALELGREVMAVPGPVGALQSEGTLEILREGARLVRHAGDVLEEIGLSDRPLIPPGPPLGGDARAVFEALGATGALPDRVVERTGLPPGQVLSWLLRLELEGRVRRLPDGTYAPMG